MGVVLMRESKLANQLNFIHEGCGGCSYDDCPITFPVSLLKGLRSPDS